MTSTLAPVLFMCLLLYLAGMIQVWIWAVGQWVRRSSLRLPEFIPQPRNIPWGIGTMVLVLVAYLGINLGAVEFYLLAIGRTRNESKQTKNTMPAVAKAKPTEAAQPSGSGGNSTEIDRSLPKPQIATDKFRNPPRESSLLSVTEGMFLLTLINELLIVFIPCIVRLGSGGSMHDLGVTLEKWPSQIKIGVAGALFIAPVVYFIQFAAMQVWSSNEHPVQDMIRNQFSAGVAYLATLSAVVVAPIVEELMFRGLIQTWLFKLARRQIARDKIVSTSMERDPSAPSIAIESEPEEIKPSRAARQAIVMTSFFFAIVHYQQWPAPIPIFLLSLALGTLYQQTGSLLASISMHATFNSISTLLLLLSMTVEPGELPRNDPLPQSVNSYGLGEFFDSTAENPSKAVSKSTDNRRIRIFFPGLHRNGLLEFRQGFWRGFDPILEDLDRLDPINRDPTSSFEQKFSNLSRSIVQEVPASGRGRVPCSEDLSRCPLCHGSYDFGGIWSRRQDPRCRA